MHTTEISRNLFYKSLRAFCTKRMQFILSTSLPSSAIRHMQEQIFTDAQVAVQKSPKETIFLVRFFPLSQFRMPPLSSFYTVFPRSSAFLHVCIQFYQERGKETKGQTRVRTMLSYTDTRECTRTVTGRNVVWYRIIAFRFDDIINTVSIERGCPLFRYATFTPHWLSILIVEKRNR